MKKLVLLLAVIASVSFFSCNKGAALLIAQLLLTVLLLIALLLIALLLLTLQRLIALRLNLSDKQKSLKLFPQGKQLSFLHPSPPPHLLHSRCNDLCEAPCGISDAEGANHIIT